MKPFALTDVAIGRFAGDHVVNRFDCGVGVISRFLKNKAKIADRRNEHRVFCARMKGSANVIGYYALQVGSDSVEDLPDEHKRKYVKTYAAFPAINLTFVGVDLEHQRRGLGSFLLMDVLTKVAELAENAGFYALTLVSYDEKSTSFYRSLGFEIYSEDLLQPKMLYPVDDVLSLVYSSE